MSDIEEEWRPVRGWEGLYEVSNLARVRSISRFKTPLVRKQQLSVHGYWRVTLKGKGRPDETGNVHRLVADAFLGPIPEGLVVCHDDGNPRNNAIINLRIDTYSSNMLDQVRHGTHVNANKTHCAKGHPYSPENTIRRSDNGGRKCKKCQYAAVAAWEAKHRRREAA